MSSATSRTGRNAKAVIDDTLVLRVTNHNLNPTTGENAWGDSDSEGETNRSRGRNDKTGTIEEVFDTGREIYDLAQPGDTIKLVLWQTTAAGDYWAFSRFLVTNFTTEHNADDQSEVRWTLEGGQVGKAYFPGEAGAPNEILPAS